MQLESREIIRHSSQSNEIQTKLRHSRSKLLSSSQHLFQTFCDSTLDSALMHHQIIKWIFNAAGGSIPRTNSLLGENPRQPPHRAERVRPKVQHRDSALGY